MVYKLAREKQQEWVSAMAWVNLKRPSLSERSQNKSATSGVGVGRTGLPTVSRRKVLGLTDPFPVVADTQRYVRLSKPIKLNPTEYLSLYVNLKVKKS